MVVSFPIVLRTFQNGIHDLPNIFCISVCHQKILNKFLREGLKLEFIKLWNVEGALVSPNDITRWKCK